MTNLLSAARKILAAPNDELTPQFAAEIARNAPVADVAYMLAHERHRRGLPVRMVQG